MRSSTEQQQQSARPAVPFFDLSPSHQVVAPDILRDVAELIESGAFTNGPQVAAFESDFADWCGVAHCVGVGSGHDALRLGLRSLGVGAGDEVILPANTFASTAEAVIEVGANPVLVDATWADYNIDVDAVAAAITPRTRALVPVHLYGQMADMQALRRLADDHDLQLLEDSCQAHGAARDGLGAGAVGDAAAFSFYPAKNLGAFGDAGALTTSDQRVAETVRALREHGQREKYFHDMIGCTARLDTIQALVLRAKLPKLSGWNEQRKALALAYLEQLEGVDGIELPPCPQGSDPVWHLFVVRVADPESLAQFLRERGIGTGRHYPYPLHLMPAFSDLGHERGAFPVAEQLAAQCLSLPLYPGMTDDEVETVVTALRDYFARG